MFPVLFVYWCIIFEGNKLSKSCFEMASISGMGQTLGNFIWKTLKKV
jgi:hypothetical protein